MTEDIISELGTGIDVKDSESVHILEVMSLKKETDAAWLFEVKNNLGWWLPKSRCSFNYVEMVVEMPQWLYDKKIKEDYIKVY